MLCVLFCVIVTFVLPCGFICILLVEEGVVDDVDDEDVVVVFDVEEGVVVIFDGDAAVVLCLPIVIRVFVVVVVVYEEGFIDTGADGLFPDEPDFSTNDDDVVVFGTCVV